MRALLLGTACAVALAGCAATTTAPAPSGAASAPAPVASAPVNPLQQLANFTVADINNADADAVAHNDTIAHTCYPVLAGFVQSLPAAGGTVSGALSAFQQARDVGNAVNTGLPASLKIACAPLLMDDQLMLARLGIIAGGAAATAGMVVPVPVMPVP